MKHFLKYFCRPDSAPWPGGSGRNRFIAEVCHTVGPVPYPGKYFLGLHRHLWADIHLSLALFFLLLILLHLGLNWNWLVPSTRQYFQRGCNKGLWALLASLLVIF